MPSEAYIKCWSRGDVCIVAKACGAAGALGKNPMGLEPGGKAQAWDGMIICGCWCGENEEDGDIKTKD